MRPQLRSTAKPIKFDLAQFGHSDVSGRIMLSFRDPEEMSCALKHANVSAMQISRGHFGATWAHHEIDDWSLQLIDFREGQCVCRGHAPQDRFAVVVPMQTAAGFRLLGREVLQRTVAAYAPGSEHVDVSTAGSAQAILVAPPDLAHAWDREERWLPQSGSYAFEAVASGHVVLVGLLSRIAAAARAHDLSTASHESRRSLSDALYCALAGLERSDVSDLPVGRPRMPRPALLRQLAVIMEERRGEPLYAGELARELGVSQASLHRVFQEWFGMPPARYLTLRRFYLARRWLREGREQSVTSVASALGFWDLSRFSKVYRQVFGELPSETLRGRRSIADNVLRN
jgi:AraC family ethanolamine operon transcriptional activator